MTLVFVGGVHGVGKSTCCAEVARLADCVHVAASDIIRRERAGAIASSGKLVADVDGNQNLLIRGFHNLQRAASQTSILLDGHFAMRDSTGKIQSVSADVFRALGIDHLVCLSDAPEAIAIRAKLRDGKAPAAEDIAELQEAELQNAKLVAAALDVSFTQLRAGDIEALKRLVARTSA